MDHKDHPVTTVKAKAAPAAEKRPANLAHPSLRVLERPANLTGTNAPGFGSDVVADTLRALEIPYIALNPGASYRGLHDSIVNFLGNETPQMLLRQGDGQGDGRGGAFQRRALPRDHGDIQRLV
jgi:hypothetical protein